LWAIVQRKQLTLEQVLARARARNALLSTRQLGLILLQLLQAIEFARSRGVAHGNITPRNCFIAHDGRIILGNWEHAKIFSHQTQLDKLVGLEDQSSHVLGAQSLESGTSGSAATNGPMQSDLGDS